MKKTILCLCLSLFLWGCDSSSSSDVGASSDSETNAGNGSAGAGTDGGDSGSGSDSDTDTGDNSGSGDDTGSGDDGGTETPQPAACVPPVHGEAFVPTSAAVIVDGCTQGDAVQFLDDLSVTAEFTFDADFDSDVVAQYKGLYVYTNGTGPGYLSTDASIVEGYPWGNQSRYRFVTAGPGVYYIPLTGGYNKLLLRGSPAVSGESFGITEVTRVLASDDIATVPKGHSSISGAGSSASASAHPLRNLTHQLAGELQSQLSEFVATIESSGCYLINNTSATASHEIAFVDATGELGQAWSTREFITPLSDTAITRRQIYAIDWNFADNSTVADIAAHVNEQDWLWSRAMAEPHPDAASDCSAPVPAFASAMDYDLLRPQALDGTFGGDFVWQY